MAEDFKFREVFNLNVVRAFAQRIKAQYADFAEEDFCRFINERLETLNFGARAQLIREALKDFLPSDFSEALKILLAALPEEIQGEELKGYEGFIVMPQTAFVSQYGLAHFDLSMQALYEMTKRFTAENDIRVFIEHFPEKTLKVLAEWVKDSNCHVRRLVSEGTRPRLPLARRLKNFQQDPRPVIALLEQLKEDPVLYVRRSVANNLNDIAKDQPKIVTELLAEWQKIDNPHTQWLIRHALRTLLKQGNPEALAILGFQTFGIKVSDFRLSQTQVKIGENLDFSFTIHSESAKSQKLMIDYIIYYQKANGKQAPKVFKLTQKVLAAQSQIHVQKSQDFIPRSTRRLYAGKHRIALQINGKIYQEADFHLC